VLRAALDEKRRTASRTDGQDKQRSACLIVRCKLSSPPGRGGKNDPQLGLLACRWSELHIPGCIIPPNSLLVAVPTIPSLHLPHSQPTKGPSISFFFNHRHAALTWTGRLQRSITNSLLNGYRTHHYGISSRLLSASDSDLIWTDKVSRSSGYQPRLADPAYGLEQTLKSMASSLECA
jgi:hypothetical protein